MEIRSIEKTGLIRWLVLFCAGFAFGCAVSLGYVPFWLQTECFIDRAPVRQAVGADHGSDQIGRERQQWPMAIHGDFETLASDVEEPAHHADTDYQLVRSAHARVRTDHGQLCSLVEEVLKKRDVYFTLGIAQDHGLIKAQQHEPRNTPTAHPNLSTTADQDGPNA